MYVLDKGRHGCCVTKPMPQKGVQYVSVKYTEAFKFVIIWATLILMDLGHFAEG